MGPDRPGRVAAGVRCSGPFHPLGTVRTRPLPPDCRVTRSLRHLLPGSRRSPQCENRTPRGARGLLAALASCAVCVGPPAFAETAESDEVDGPVFTVGRFVVDYREPHPDLPSIDALLPLEVTLRQTESGWASPRAGQPTRALRIDRGEVEDPRFHASALGAIARALLARIHEEDLLGVYVRPSAEDIDIRSERDLRAEGDTDLRLVIWVGRIDDVRTVAAGSRVQGEWRIDNPIHRKIRSYSPLHPATAGIEETTDVLDRRKLEDYIHLLNRHPGRHVEAALSASSDNDGITLDYRIHESRPWNAYVQSSNTGTERTSPWQTRFGYVHRQVTNRDDILSIEYLNSGGDKVHGISVAYDAPWFAPKRPDWMHSSGREPAWIAWADRSAIPWWGLGRLRWRVQGGWVRIFSEPVGQLVDFSPGVDQVRSSDWNFGGRLSYNVYQHRNWFVDTYLAARFRGVEIDNQTVGNTGNATLLLTDIGVDVNRTNLYSSTFGRFWAERGVPIGQFEDYSPAFDANLGRASASSRWWTLNFDLGASYYLEPLLFPKAFRDPATARSSTLSHELSLGARGQYAFDYRLIPQVSQVIGGLYTVRGFQQGVAVGDSVFTGTAEYRFHIPRSLPIRREPVDVPWIGDFRIAPQQVYGRPDWDLILRVFIDGGKSIRNNPQLATGTELDQTLVGAGVGLEFVFRGNLRARVDWARGIYQSVDCQAITPLGNPDTSCLTAKQGNIDPNGRFYFLFNVVY